MLFLKNQSYLLENPINFVPANILRKSNLLQLNCSSQIGNFRDFNYVNLSGVKCIEESVNCTKQMILVTRTCMWSSLSNIYACFVDANVDFVC